MNNKNNIAHYILMGITAVLILVTGIIFKQKAFFMLPLFVSIVIGLLQSKVSRYSSLIGGINSIVYAIVYFSLDLKANAVYAILFSFPVQIVTFILWSKAPWKHSTVFRKLSLWGRIATAVGFAAVFYVVNLVNPSEFAFLDSLSSLLGILLSFLTMFAFIEYSYLMIPSGIISIILNYTITKSNPAQITYLIFSCYSIICQIKALINIRKLYAEQKGQMKNENQ